MSDIVERARLVQRLANLAGCERCGGSGWLESTDERGGQVMEPCGHGDWESLEIADGYSDEDLSRLDTTADKSGASK